MLTNKNAVRVLTSAFLVTMKIRNAFPIRDRSIVTQYRAVNIAVCRGLNKACKGPPVEEIKTISVMFLKKKKIIKQTKTTTTKKLHL